MRLEKSQFLQFLNVANRTAERPHITHIQTAVVVTVVLAHATTGAWVFFSPNVEPFRNLINQPPVLSLKTQHALAGCPCLCFPPYFLCCALYSVSPSRALDGLGEAVTWETMFRGLSVGLLPCSDPINTIIGLVSRELTCAHTSIWSLFTIRMFSTIIPTLTMPRRLWKQK